MRQRQFLIHTKPTINQETDEQMRFGDSRNSVKTQLDSIASLGHERGSKGDVVRFQNGTRLRKAQERCLKGNRPKSERRVPRTLHRKSEQ